ncbi:WG repeat-containing protein [bacterium]|nr:WG repeat-containing protein [bacterium]
MISKIMLYKSTDKSSIFNIIEFQVISFFIFFTVYNVHSENLYPIVQKNRVGYINREGKIIIRPKLETKFKKSYYKYEGKFFPFYDLPINAYFSEGKAVYRKSWRVLFIKFGYEFGVIDTLNKILIEPQEAEFGQFHNNLSKVKTIRKPFEFSIEGYSFADLSGNIKSDQLFTYVSDYSDGSAIVLIDNKYNYIDTLGNIMFDFNFEDVSLFQNGLAAVRIDSLWGIIDKSGKFVIPPKYLQIWNKSNGFYRIYDGKNYSFINESETNIFKKSFFSANDFSEGYAAVKFSELEYGFIDTLGQAAFNLNKCNGVGNFQNGLARVQIDSKWGYINLKGEFVIKPIYDYAINFTDGFALVWQGENVFIINTDGKHIWEYNFRRNK